MLAALTGETGFCEYVIRAFLDSSPPLSVLRFGEGLQADALAPLQPALPIGSFSTWGTVGFQPTGNVRTTVRTGVMGEVLDETRCCRSGTPGCR